MAPLGSAALICALITAVYAIGAAVAGVRTGRPALVVSARRAILCVAGLTTLCVVLLEVAYVRSDFSVALVAKNSSTDTPLFYRLTAMWSSQPGSLLAWAFLGCGIMLGALWSYSELGWGGYWAWDPVENASLMPWLVATAFLHSGMVQERRGMLRVWNASLVMGAFILSLVGTFLVRSGILQSIHAFGASTLGIPFVLFIAAMTLGSVA